MNNETFSPAEELQRKTRSRKMVTFLIVFAIVMFFAGLTSAYVVSMSGGYWVDITLPNAFYVSTVAIVLSSVFAQLALMAARSGAMKRIAPLLAVTLMLGGVFTWSQFQGWKELISKGQFAVGRMVQATGVYGKDYTILRQGEALVMDNGSFYAASDEARSKPLNADIDEQKNTASSYLYVLTAGHLAHLAFGLLSLLVMIIMAAMGRYLQNDHSGLWAGTVYWHFLGGLWVYLLLFLLFVH
jgi:cytochrome c oxidase subunit III